MYQSEREALLAAGGAMCRACGNRMLKADGCTWPYIRCGKNYYTRIKFGDEGAAKGGGRCCDCGAKPGHYHHVCCAVEQCPICGGKLMYCDCAISFADTLPAGSKTI